MEREVTIKDFDIAGAERIGIPKGDDSSACIKAFEAATGIEVPVFNGRELTATSSGREFFLLKGKDMPGLAASGLIDLGVAGEDSIEMDFYYGRPVLENLQFLPVGAPMCCLELLAEKDKRDELEERLWHSLPGSSAVMRAVTPLPGIVNYQVGRLDLPVEIVDLPPGVTISGSMEIMPRLLRRLGVELVADRVQTGKTAQANGLARVTQMWDIYPALVGRLADGSCC
ncbi:MAG TPA: hypothetical protein VHB72_04645 [Candidatus Saccharimonadales bacterium]|nr:hypothetical protein [Candidatus Saccharimonadales bacterium]